MPPRWGDTRVGKRTNYDGDERRKLFVVVTYKDSDVFDKNFNPEIKI